MSDQSVIYHHLQNVKRASETEWTPMVAGGRPTRWYFELVGGSYSSEMARQGSTADRQEWVMDNPPNQKFGKMDLAIYENTWSLMPHFVSRGGEKSFTVYLQGLEDTEVPGMEEYRGIFQRLVAKAILFKQTDRDVGETLGHTYKRSVVAYTLAYYLRKTGDAADLDQIWRSQQLDQDIRNDLLGVAGPLKEEMFNSAAGRNVTSWSKSEECWEHLQSCDFGV